MLVQLYQLIMGHVNKEYNWYNKIKIVGSV